MVTQFSTYLKKNGLLVNLLAEELFAPFAEEEMVMKYSEDEMIKNLGDIQTRLKLMNLVEIYTIILIVVCAVTGAISFAISSKFIRFFRREQIGNNLKSTIVNGIDMDEHESVKEYMD